MSARDETDRDITECLYEALCEGLPIGHELADQIASECVEALRTVIPGDVLVRLAIERGALAEADVYDAEDIARGAPGQLYRVVEP